VVLKRFLVFGGLIALVVVGLVLNFWWNLGNNTGYSPEQPIPFSHKIHAGDNKIPCLYCHAEATLSRHATVPSLNVCMNCHGVVKTDSPFIQELTKKYKEGKPIEWVRVHDLPDHVYFSHKRHLAKNIKCEACHGDVAQMDRIFQKETLLMGFCVNCHRTNKGPTGEDQKGPTDCYTCHN